jgi:hypothetical protein
METREKNRFIYYIFEYNLKSIHNKDYSVVKTFKAASYLIMMSLSFCVKKNITFEKKLIINQSTQFGTRFH